jgi:hypothetical protein
MNIIDIPLALGNEGAAIRCRPTKSLRSSAAGPGIPDPRIFTRNLEDGSAFPPDNDVRTILDFGFNQVHEPLGISKDLHDYGNASFERASA